jgi:hypothetical protein
MTRTIQRAVARMLVAFFLFAQMIVAAHACQLMPAYGADAGAASYMTLASNSSADMPAGCNKTKVDSANLCAAHCQAGHQNTDAAQIPAVPGGVLTVSYVMPPASAASNLAYYSTPAEAVTAATPPLAILHCCFRI